MNSIGYSLIRQSFGKQIGQKHAEKLIESYKSFISIRESSQNRHGLLTQVFFLC